MTPADDAAIAEREAADWAAGLAHWRHVGETQPVATIEAYATALELLADQLAAGVLTATLGGPAVGDARDYLHEAAEAAREAARAKMLGL